MNYEYSELNSEYSEVSSEYSELNYEYSELNSEYSELSSEHPELDEGTGFYVHRVPRGHGGSAGWSQSVTFQRNKKCADGTAVYTSIFDGFRDNFVVPGPSQWAFSARTATRASAARCQRTTLKTEALSIAARGTLSTAARLAE